MFEFLGSLLWVALFAGVLWRHDKPIRQLLSSLNKRIELGASIKAGPFELAEVKSQDSEQQRLNLNHEAESVASELVPQPSPIDKASAKLAYLHAEDLALRAIQNEFGAPIARQVELGTFATFDGFFARKGELYVIEVKLHRAPRNIKIDGNLIRDTLWKVIGLGQQRLKLIYVAVFDARDIDIAAEEEKLRYQFSHYQDSVIVRCFTLIDLNRRFGVDGEQG